MKTVESYIKETVKQIDQGSYNYLKMREILSGLNRDVRRLGNRLGLLALNYYEKGEFNTIWSWYDGVQRGNWNILGDRHPCAFSYTQKWRGGFFCYVGEGKDVRKITHTSSFGTLKRYLCMNEPSRAEVGARFWCEALKKAVRKSRLSRANRRGDQGEWERAIEDVKAKTETIWEQLVLRHIKKNPIELGEDDEDNMELYNTQIVGSWRTPKFTISFRLGKGTLLYLDEKGSLNSPFIEGEENVTNKLQVNISEKKPKGVMLITDGAVEGVGEKRIMEDIYKLLVYVSSRFHFDCFHLKELTERLHHKFAWDCGEKDIAMVVDFCQSIDVKTMINAYEIFLELE